MKKGFTLIELLIVVAIIAILAAIAIPNFLAAQIRAKVSRTKSDMRSTAVAIESYFVDNNDYPLVSHEKRMIQMNGGYDGSVTEWELDTGITTPVAYITSLAKDPFGEVAPTDPYTAWGVTNNYWYATKRYYDRTDIKTQAWSWLIYPNGQTQGNPAMWVLISKGPDRHFAQNTYPGALEVDMPYVWVYDPSNGTISRGNIVISGP